MLTLDLQLLLFRILEKSQIFCILKYFKTFFILTNYSFLLICNYFYIDIYLIFFWGENIKITYYFKYGMHWHPENIIYHVDYLYYLLIFLHEIIWIKENYFTWIFIKLFFYTCFILFDKFIIFYPWLKDEVSSLNLDANLRHVLVFNVHGF